MLLDMHRTEVIAFLDDMFPSLLQALADPFDEVVLLVLEVHACVAREAPYFHRLIIFLLHNFQMDRLLLEKRGTLILRRLCALLDAEHVYRELSTILEKETDLDFARVMIEALNLILFTASELEELRALLKQSLSNLGGQDFFVALYSSWCHSPIATISLCLLAQAYQHASSVLQLFVEKDIDMRFLFQLDKLVKLLEMPIFTHLRLQLLDPGRYPWLLKTLYGLLMLLPQQSVAFGILKKRLKTVPTYTFSGEELNISALRSTSGNLCAQLLTHIPGLGNGMQGSEDGDDDTEFASGTTGINFAVRLQQFEHMQQQHRFHRSCRNQIIAREDG